MRNSIMHYKEWNTAIATGAKFAAQAKRELHLHSLNPLCFVPSDAYYFSWQLLWEFDIKKFIDEFNNSVHLSMKASKKVVEIPID